VSRVPVQQVAVSYQPYDKLPFLLQQRAEQPLPVATPVNNPDGLPTKTLLDLFQETSSSKQRPISVSITDREEMIP